MRKREVDTEWTIAFKRILGDELRTARTMRRWSRQQLHSKLFSKFGLDISLQTIATYELGTRGVSAARLAQICMVLEVDVRDLLDQVMERLSAEARRHWIVDLVAASRIEDTELAPLRRWAVIQLRAVQNGKPATARIGLGALKPLAVLCRVNILDLMHRLARLPADQHTDDETDRSLSILERTARTNG